MWFLFQHPGFSPSGFRCNRCATLAEVQATLPQVTP